MLDLSLVSLLLKDMGLEIYRIDDYSAHAVPVLKVPNLLTSYYRVFNLYLKVKPK